MALCAVGFLTPDFSQFGGLQTGVFFQNAECIATFDGAMLGGVPGKNDAAVFLVGEISHTRQCANAQQTCFINPDNLSPNLLL